jgi:hypothetical protein
MAILRVRRVGKRPIYAGRVALAQGWVSMPQEGGVYCSQTHAVLATLLGLASGHCLLRIESAYSEHALSAWEV